MGALTRIRETFRRTPAGAPAPVVESQDAPTPAQVRRVGYEYGLPLNIQNTSSLTAATSERQQVLAQLHQAYMACNWVSASVDLIARTVTAGGLQVVAEAEDGGDTPDDTPPVARLKRLIRFCNPREDMVQLLRNVATDLMLFGDAYLEVVSLLGEPVALYTLDATTMTVIADQHGEVSGYIQDVDGVRVAPFKPEQVIHISLDAPRGGLYGVSPAQKALLPVTAWLFTMATLKECFRRGDPPRLHVDLQHFQDADVQRWREQYRVYNLGPKAVGEPVITTGGGAVGVLDGRKVTDYLDADRQLRDQIISAFGVPPAKLGIIESGNLGGGTGEQQDKTFRVNTIIPVANLILEKLNFHLLQSGFGITGFHLEFMEIDFRDSTVVEQIRETRLRNGAYCVDVETEILTASGWKHYTDLQVGEKVLTINHETGISEWQECQEVCVFQAAERDMVRIDMRGHSSLTTTNHRWPVERYNQTARSWQRRWATSETLSYFDRIPTAARNADLPLEAMYDDAFVELVAWFWTEGHAPARNRHVFITQVKQEGVERIRTALEKLFGPPYEQSRYHRKTDRGAWIEQVRPGGKRNFRIAASHGQAFRDVVDDHVVSTDFLMALTQEQLDLFIEISLMADGANSKTGQETLGQKRRGAAEQFQLACILAGRSATIRERVYKRDGYREWIVNVNKKSTVSPVKAAKSGFSARFETVKHDGVVWCPVTPNQSWMARRDGTVYFTGNTLNRYRAEIGEPPVDGGDDPIFMERTFIADWANMQDLAKSFIIKNLGANTAGQDANDLAPPPTADGPKDPEDGPGLDKDAAQGDGPKESVTEKRDRATRVFDQLLSNYPATVLGWVQDVDWSGPQDIKVEDLDFDHEESWRASHEPGRVQHFIKRMRKRKKVEPAVLIKHPGNGKYVIIDGHHRALAARTTGVPLSAWVGHVTKATGPWDELHDSQYHNRKKPDEETWDDLYRRCLDEALARL